jgi:ribosomal protein L14
MILPGTRLLSVDNSGVVKVKFLGTLGYSKKRAGTIGDVGVFSFVKKTVKAHSFRVKVFIGAISGTRVKSLYKNGIRIRFSFNTMFLVKWDTKTEMAAIGTRIRGPLSILCKKQKYLEAAVGDARRLF